MRGWGWMFQKPTNQAQTSAYPNSKHRNYREGADTTYAIPNSLSLCVQLRQLCGFPPYEPRSLPS